MIRWFRRRRRRLPRPLRRLLARWLPPPPRPTAAADLTPSPGVAAFLNGESVRQVAYFVGSQDPGIIDPRDDWPGAVADAHAVIRAYITRLQDTIRERSQ